MMFNRTRLSAFAIVALIVGFLTPVVVAPSAQAATITLTADCANPPISPSAVSGSPGDVIEFVTPPCDVLYLEAGLVDNSSAINVPNETPVYDPAGNPPHYDVVGSSNFTSVEITLGSSPGTYELSLEGGSSAVIFNVTISGASPTPPTPTPATPPSSPTDPSATAGDGAASITWGVPTSTGSFPVTHYQVQSTPSSSGCLVPVTSTNCQITGLRNGISYIFRIRALNGGGWGTWAETTAITPRPEPRTSIVITGSRATNDREVRIAGVTTGLAGATVQARVKLDGATDFADGSSRIVDSQGTFTWQRRSSRGLEVYFTAGTVESNTVRIAPRG